jgi:hypothetical protein
MGAKGYSQILWGWSGGHGCFGVRLAVWARFG